MWGVEFLAFNVLLHPKSEQKVMGICTPISLKKSVQNKKNTFTICVGCVLIAIGHFLFEKQIFNGLLKVIVIQNILNMFFLYS